MSFYGTDFFHSGAAGVLVVELALAIIAIAGNLIHRVITKRGIDAGAALHTAQAAIDGADKITDIIKAAFPKNPIADIADKIIDYAKIGVGKAEQLYLINTIDSEARNAEARKFVYDALAVAGIDRTDAIDKIIDGAIEAAVLTLGHKTKPPGAAGFDTDACEGYGGGVAE